MYDTFILLSGIFASVYFIFFMIFSSQKEKILDDMTESFNRRFFEKFLRKNINPQRSILVLISIDNIKDINERYGIENGDKVLQKFSHIIDSYFSTIFGSVPIARMRAGDFLLLINAPEKRVKEAVENFLLTYDNQFIDNIEIKLFATYTQADHNDIKHLLDHLYEEIYYCKGKCKLTSKKRPKKDSDFDAIVRRSIEENKILLFYQPLYHLQVKKFDYIEILVKLLDSEGNIIHPSQYIPVMNRLGLENSYDLAVVTKLIEECKKYQLDTKSLYSFNLSPYSVRNRLFSKRFFKLFEDSVLSPHNAVIELYEPTVYNDIKYYKSILQMYKEHGFKIAFNNFGAFNASVEYIKNIEADFVLFDKFFTKKIDEDRYRVLLENWIVILHKLGIKSIIKFIDKIELLDIFARIGADYVGGFAIAKPMQAEELKKFLGEKYEIW
ncbi:diguanylate cyclase/phosphodiesterase [Nitratiruptor sp. YY09-18]|nr:diguanylate cyclase/phosphodiesterase [Nitratiruptor sp. YY09-18]